jgi:hypothetical protein
MKVKQFISKTSGRPIPNQFIITTEKGLYFQSYNSIICFLDKKNNKIYLDPEYWNYSKTTSKYRNQFLNSLKIFPFSICSNNLVCDGLNLVLNSLTKSQEINNLINSGVIEWKNLNS